MIAPVRIVEGWNRPVATAARPEAEPLPWSGTGPAQQAEGVASVPRLYLRSDVVKTIDGRAREGAIERREDMGLLLGDWALDGEGRPYAVAWDAPTGPLSASPVSVRFTREGLEEVARSLEGQPRPYLVVGWYHTHLDLGCFMSERDLRTQRGGFPHGHQVALVVDAVRWEVAAFANGPQGPGTEPAVAVSYREWREPER